MKKHLFKKTHKVHKNSKNLWYLSHGAFLLSLPTLSLIEVPWVCVTKKMVLPLPSAPNQDLLYLTEKGRPSAFLILTNF